MKTIRVAGRVVIVHRVHDGGYWAQVKDAPGCIAVGRTMAELRRNMKEALVGYAEAEAKMKLRAIDVPPEEIAEDHRILREEPLYLVKVSPTGAMRFRPIKRRTA